MRIHPDGEAVVTAAPFKKRGVYTDQGLAISRRLLLVSKPVVPIDWV